MKSLNSLKTIDLQKVSAKSLSSKQGKQKVIEMLKNQKCVLISGVEGLAQVTDKMHDLMIAFPDSTLRDTVPGQHMNGMRRTFNYHSYSGNFRLPEHEPLVMPHLHPDFSLTNWPFPEKDFLGTFAEQNRIIYENALPVVQAIDDHIKETVSKDNYVPLVNAVQETDWQGSYCLRYESKSEDHNIGIHWHYDADLLNALTKDQIWNDKWERVERPAD